MAQEDEPRRISSYAHTFFAHAQPQSAFDMLTLVPGFAFVDSDPDVRGLAAASGNVLIDGQWSAVKTESLETLLRRIPAHTVERIELIRPGATGYDMRGQTLLANVVRIDAARTHAAVEAGSTLYEHEVWSPKLTLELSRDFGARRLLEFSVSGSRSVVDEHGAGHQERRSLDGSLLRHSRYHYDGRERIVELDAAYEQPLADGNLRASASYSWGKDAEGVVEDRTFPRELTELVKEREREDEAELTLRYGRNLRRGLGIELLALHRDSRENETELESGEGDSASFIQREHSQESIARAALQRSGERATLDAGIELARNVLDSHSTLYVDEILTPLPAANVRVEERRIEPFLMTTWRVDPRWTLEAGSGFEFSQLKQEGDNNVRKSFFFAKPRALVSFTPQGGQRWRFLIERRVGQLDFEDFVSSTSLEVKTVNAGNPELEPDRAWVAELTWEREFLERGALLVTARREDISHLIDRVPIDFARVLDGVGNIGDGVREELEFSLSLPLAEFGLESGLLKTRLLWRESRARDPVTGERRDISSDLPFEGEVTFTHDLPARGLHWGIVAKLASRWQEFLIDEVREERWGPEVELFVEYKGLPFWSFRAYAGNLLDRKAERERRIYDAARNAAPLNFIETRSLRLGPYIGFSVRRTFGELSL